MKVSSDVIEVSYLVLLCGNWLAQVRRVLIGLSPMASV